MDIMNFKEQIQPLLIYYDYNKNVLEISTQNPRLDKKLNKYLYKFNFWKEINFTRSVSWLKIVGILINLLSYNHSKSNTFNKIIRSLYSKRSENIPLMRNFLKKIFNSKFMKKSKMSNDCCKYMIESISIVDIVIRKTLVKDINTIREEIFKKYKTKIFGKFFKKKFNIICILKLCYEISDSIEIIPKEKSFKLYYKNNCWIAVFIFQIFSRRLFYSPEEILKNQFESKNDSLEYYQNYHITIGENLNYHTNIYNKYDNTEIYNDHYDLKSYGVKDRKELEKEADFFTILKEIKNHFRTNVPDKPEKEEDIQKCLEIFLKNKKYPFKREKRKVPYSYKSYQPDFTNQRLKMALEVKYINSKKKAITCIDEMNADLTGYSKKWIHILFVCYDKGGNIPDINEYTKDFKQDKEIISRCIVIKH